jgi:hypothetical protein
MRCSSGTHARVPDHSSMNFRAVHGILLLTVFGLCGHMAGASTVVVPDDAATIQAGLGLADTVLVRSGTYPERFLMDATENHPKAVMRYPGSTDRPIVGGVDLESEYPSLRLTLSGLECLGAVHLEIQSFDTHVLVDSCAIDSGIVQLSVNDLTDVRLAVTHGVVQGVIDGIFEDTSLNSDSLLSGRVQCSGEGTISATSCVFISSGILCNKYGGGGVIATGNRFEDCSRGIEIHEGDIHATSNQFVRCGIAILDNYDGGPIDGNLVLDCDWGIEVNAGSSYSITNNRIFGSIHTGIDVLGTNAQIAGNVVGRCGETGIHVLLENYDATLSGNTSYQNHGSGFVIETGTGSPPSVIVSNNIGFQNGGHGIECRGAASVALGCNDWFANDSSAVAGTSPSPQDLAVDPLFCDVANDSVHLAAKSALLNAPGCGLIGALGKGCDMTPTLVSLFTAERVTNGVRVRWQLAASIAFESVWVERAGAQGGQWAAIAAEGSSDGATTVELDRTATADRDYWYRLVARARDAVAVIGAPIEVAMTAPAVSELRSITPNPAGADVHIEFDLARDGRIQLEVLDVQGRSVTVLAGGVWKAGRHSVSWSTRPVPAPGVYFVRYRFPEGSAIRRLVRIS